MAVESYFRGFRGISEIAARLDPLVAGLNICVKPDAPIALAPIDFDLIVRYPKAAKLAGFDMREKGPVYKYHPLRRHKGKDRYEKRATSGEGAQSK